MPPIVRSTKLTEIRADGFIRRLIEERDYIESLETRLQKLRRVKIELDKQLR